MFLGLYPEDCAVPPKSNLAHLTQLVTLNFLSTKSTSVDFDVPDLGLLMRVEAHAPGVFRLRCAPTDVLQDAKPSARGLVLADMLLARHEAICELFTSSVLKPANSGWNLVQGDVRLEITRTPLQLALYRGDDCLMRTQPGASLACASSTADTGLWRFDVPLDIDEAIHGLGESTGSGDRRGVHLVSDAPEQRALPLAWSTGGWGMFVNTLERVEHDLAHTDPNHWTVVAHDTVLDLFLFVGDPSEILNQYTALTGRPGQPGLWPLGVWLDQAPGQSLDLTLQQVQTFRDQEWGLDAVTLAAPALYGFQPDKPSFEWATDRVADSRDMFARAQELNIQFAASSFPGVLSNSGMFEEWEDRGWLLIRDEDSCAQVFPGNEVTGGQPFGLLDLTHKDAYKLWSDRQRQTVDEGLGATVCDARFDIPDGITARGGETGEILRILYPMLARQALFEAVAGHKTPQEGVVLSSDLFPSVQRYAWQTGPRVTNDWDGLQLSLRTALSLSDSGIPLQTHTLGSVHAPTNTMTPELYIRWLAACVFSGNFSFQGVPALLPDAFDDSTQELVKHWLQWRYRLIPYISGILEDAVRTGLPVQRSMALAFPNDHVAQLWDTQYLLGPSLLVAPIMQPGTKTQVYLPEGDAWWDLSTGWRYEGGTTWTVEAGLDSLPLFGREGHMLCLGPTAQHTGDFNSARILDEVWMFGMPEHSPVVMRNKIRVMQMQGSSYIKGLEGLRILPCEGLEVKRRGAEVRISRAR